MKLLPLNVDGLGTCLSDAMLKIETLMHTVRFRLHLGR